MKRKIFLLILTVCLLTIGVVGCNNSQEKPAEVLTDAMINSYLHYNFGADVSLKFNFNENVASENKFLTNITSDPQSMIKFINSILNKSEIKYGMNLVTKENNENTFKADFHMGLCYDNKDFLSGIVNFDSWQANMWVPQLLDNAIAYDLKEELGNDFEFEKLTSIDFSKYVRFLLEKLKYFENIKDSQNEYRKILVEYYNDKVEKLEDGIVTVIEDGKNKDIPVNRYKIVLDTNTASDVNIKLLKLAKKDEDLKKYIVEAINEYKDLVIKDKVLEKMDVNESDFINKMDQEIDRINTNWEEYLDITVKQLEKAVSNKDDTDNKMLYKVCENTVLSIDSNKNIRKVEANLDIDSFNTIQQNINNSVLKDKDINNNLGKIQDNVKGLTENNDNLKGLNVNISLIINAYDDDVKVNKPKNDTKLDMKQLIDDRDLQSGLIDELGKNLGGFLSSDVVENLLKDIKENVKLLPEDESSKIINNLDTQLNQVKFMLPLIIQSYKMQLGY